MTAPTISQLGNFNFTEIQESVFGPSVNNPKVGCRLNTQQKHSPKKPSLRDCVHDPKDPVLNPSGRTLPTFKDDPNNKDVVFHDDGSVDINTINGAVHFGGLNDFYPRQQQQQKPTPVCEMLDPNSDVHYPKEEVKDELPEWFLHEFEQRVYSSNSNDDVDADEDAKLQQSSQFFTSIEQLGNLLNQHMPYTCFREPQAKAAFFQSLLKLYSETHGDGLAAVKAVLYLPASYRKLVWRSMIDDDVLEGETCKVCLESYRDGDVLVKFACGHEFHYSCMVTWLGRRCKKSCPTCRAEINYSMEKPSEEKPAVISNEQL